MNDQLVIRDVELAGDAHLDVLIERGRIHQIGRRLLVGSGAAEIDGRGGALIHGLCDHHVHLFATTSSKTSLQCGPDRIHGQDELAGTLRAAAQGVGAGEWVRGVGYDENIAGPLSSVRLDAMLGRWRDRPVKVQHRSGHVWYLNTAAAVRLRVDSVDGVLYDADDVVANGDNDFPDLTGVSRELAGYGVTSVCDAGAHNDMAALDALRRAFDRGELRQRCLVMGTAGLDGAADHSRVKVGPLKIVVAERNLTEASRLAQQIVAAGSRGVALHAASLDALLVAVAALEEAGVAGQRIEHASVAPPFAVAAVARAGARVVTNPAFVAVHGDRYLNTVEPADLGSLYRLRSWLNAGVSLAAGSDSPYGPLDPWTAMRAAVSRSTDGGSVLGPSEGLTPYEALRLFSAPLDNPAGGTAHPQPGDVADLCLLATPWADARAHLHADLVALTFFAGVPMTLSEPSSPRR